MHVNQRRTNLIRLQLIVKINNNKALKMFVDHYYCHVYHNEMKLYLIEHSHVLSKIYVQLCQGIR